MHGSGYNLKEIRVGKKLFFYTSGIYAKEYIFFVFSFVCLLVFLLR